MKRRDFLRNSVAASVTAGVGLTAPGILKAVGPIWGGLPTGVWSGAAPATNVLHIHLLGGMAPFESFYYRDVAGSRTRGFDSEFTNLNWNSGCSDTPSALQTQFHANDSASKAVHLGPLAKPLWPSHISDKLRVIVTKHDLLPHEAAIPYTMTGLRLGAANQASPGAAIQHRFNALDQAAMTTRTVPYSYGLLPQSAGANNLLFQTMGLLGRHEGASKPLVLKIGAQFGNFINRLGRNNTSSLSDALLDNYRAQYRDWLRWQATTDLTRSKAFTDYDNSVSTLFGSPQLSSLLTTLPTTIGTEQKCASENMTFDTNSNPTATAMQAAAVLLTRPAAQRARYVCVMDSGLEPRFGFPYDVHSAGHPGDTGTNLWNVLTALENIIQNPAASAADNAGKINLNNTLVMISTEFGRTPFKSIGRQPNTNSIGRDHWPQVSWSVLIGGGVNKGVVGSVTDGSALTTDADIAYNQTDVMSAVLLAAGIDPFEDENYALGQLTQTPGGTTPGLADADHTQTLINIRQTLLGIT